ncbi:MAG: hypothetical protein GTO02_04470 [Candidatus Dadabacteria bacterium]|nr:hypothetical protein [Candidatus Dadabacteria bacterium]
MSKNIKRRRFRDRTGDLIKYLIDSNVLTTREIKRDGLKPKDIKIVVNEDDVVPQSIIDTIRANVEAKIARKEVKQLETKKDTTWGDIVKMVWDNKDLLQKVGKDIFKGMTTEEQQPPIASVIERDDEGKHDKLVVETGEIKLSPLEFGKLKEDVNIGKIERARTQEFVPAVEYGEIKTSPMEYGEIKQTINHGRITRHVPEVQYSFITGEIEPRPMLRGLSAVSNDISEIKRAITANAQLQIEPFRIDPMRQIQVDVTEGSLTYPFFVGLEDRRYPVNAPIHQVMSDYPNLDLVDMYGLQLERMRPEDLLSD